MRRAECVGQANFWRKQPAKDHHRVKANAGSNVPTFDGTAWMITYTFLGALILWCKDLPEQRRAYCLSEIWEHLEIRNSKRRYIAELAAFLIIGTVIALGVAKP